MSGEPTHPVTNTEAYLAEILKQLRLLTAAVERLAPASPPAAPNPPSQREPSPQHRRPR